MSEDDRVRIRHMIGAAESIGQFIAERDRAAVESERIPAALSIQCFESFSSRVKVTIEGDASSGRMAGNVGLDFAEARATPDAGSLTWTGDGT